MTIGNLMRAAAVALLSVPAVAAPAPAPDMVYVYIKPSPLAGAFPLNFLFPFNMPIGSPQFVCDAGTGRIYAGTEITDRPDTSAGTPVAVIPRNEEIDMLKDESGSPFFMKEGMMAEMQWQNLPLRQRINVETRCMGSPRPV